jgi:hypothetical protein
MCIFTINSNNYDNNKEKNRGGRDANTQHLAEATRCQAANWQGVQECNESTLQKELR